MIDLHIELPRGSVRQCDRPEVRVWKSGVRNIRVWIQVQDRLPDGINVRRARDRIGTLYFVARESIVRTREIGICISRAGIKDAVSIRQTLREISGTLQIRGHDSLDVDGIMLPNFFKINKEERAILDNWSTQCEPILIAQVIRLVSAIEIVSGVEVRALSVPPTAPVKLVGALFQNDVDEGPTIVAVLRRKAVVLNLELLHDLDRGLVVNVRVTAFALFRRADRTAVERDLRGRVPLAVRNEVRAGRIVVVNS